MKGLSLQYRHGMVTGYTLDKKRGLVTVYFSFYHGSKSSQECFCKMKTGHLCIKFRELPIYKADGAIDLPFLNGMRVSVKAVGCIRRLYVKDIVLDEYYYGSDEEEGC